MRKKMETEKILEFYKIKEKLKEYASTRNAREEIERLSPYLAEVDVRRALRETTEGKTMIQKCGDPPVTALENTQEFIDIAMKGGCLSAEQLESIAITLTAVRRMKDYLHRCKQFDIGLAYYEENLDSLDDVREELNSKIRNGAVDDRATNLLKDLRERIDRAESKMREKADTILRANKNCMSDSFSTLRNGHICVPVKKEFKFQIAGTVMDKSSTGNTLFIEPVSAAKYYEELQELRLDEENEERRILYTLTGLLADSAEVIFQNSRTIERLDYIFAKAKLSLEYDGIEPEITEERSIVLKNARHPLMDKSVNVPLNFQIGQGIRGVIITGPNTGGKTVAIKTVALNCYMAQCGLHIAAEKGIVCLNNQILCDIGDGQNISENLSTFSAHITNVLEILRKADRESLVIMDELGSGTDPTEGMGIAIAILEELKKSGALYLVTTHYPEVKVYAEETESVINARMTFDKETLKPLYQLVIGEAGESCAFYIARKLGMPGAMLNRAARAAYGDTESIKNKFTFDETEDIEHISHNKIQKTKKIQESTPLREKFHRGDSVMVYPDKKIGIVCEPVNEKGVLRIQMPDKKIWINHKRVKLHVAATQLYPEDYDFSIIFDSVENRKASRIMERKYAPEVEIKREE